MPASNIPARAKVQRRRVSVPMMFRVIYLIAVLAVTGYIVLQILVT